MRTLESRAMAGAFDILGVNDLIFSYVVSNWLMGLDQPAFDILAWNADSTRLPGAMHSFYLRCLYLRDELARGEMALAVQQLSLSDVKSDAGIVSPPGPKPWYETAGQAAAEAKEWRASATRQSGSWWSDWTAWAQARAGDRVKPPAMGSSQ